MDQAKGLISGCARQERHAARFIPEWRRTAANLSFVRLFPGRTPKTTDQIHCRFASTAAGSPQIPTWKNHKESLDLRVRRASFDNREAYPMFVMVRDHLRLFA